MEMKLKICMILPVTCYGENMRIVPQIGICSYITHFGHDVDWIIWSDIDREGHLIFFNGVHIYTTKIHKFISADFIILKILNKIYNILFRTRFILKTFKQGNYNLVFARDSALDALVALYIKKKYNVPFVFALSNPLNQDREYFKIVSNGPNLLDYLISELHMFITTRLLYKADLIIPTTKWIGDDLVAQGIPKTKIMPVPNGICVEAFRIKCGSDIRKKYKLNHEKLILYIGTLGKSRRLKLLIQAFSDVRKKRKDVKLLIVGSGDGEKELMEFCDELRIISDVIFTGQIPQAEVPNFIAACDIGVSPVPPFIFYKMSSPIKMFEYMAMAKPVIANEEIPEHKEVLDQCGGGILVPFTPEAFAGAIIKLLDIPEKAEEMGKKGQEWVMKNRTYKIMAQQVESEFLKLKK